LLNAEFDLRRAFCRAPRDDRQSHVELHPATVTG